MTEKSFFEVFPSLELGESLQGLFGQVKVTKVAMTRAKDLLRVYISSEKLISKKHIYEAEKAIKTQIFSTAPVRVQILEKFMLSRQYTPEKLMDVYRDSILDELKHYNIFEYNLFRQADCVFPEEDVMEMTMEDSVVAEGKSVIMISSELPEILGMCDRIYIMNEGKMVGELAGSEATQELIMSHILGTAGKEQTA